MHIQTHVYYGAIHSNQVIETASVVPVIGFMNKENVHYIYNEIPFNLKRKAMPFAG